MKRAYGDPLDIWGFHGLCRKIVFTENQNPVVLGFHTVAIPKKIAGFSLIPIPYNQLNTLNNYHLYYL